MGSVPFGQTILKNVPWNIERTPDDLDLYGVIADVDSDGCEHPIDLDGSQIDIYFYDPNDINITLWHLSSAGVDPAITIYPGVDIDPNYRIFVTNADLIAQWSEDTQVPYRFVLTDANGVPQTYFTGPANIGNSAIPGC